jgi:hypothetical protein
MGMTMTMVSTDNTSPAPRDDHTENWSAFKGASRGSIACFHLCKVSFCVVATLLNDVPSYAKNRPVETPKEEVERQLLWREEAAPNGTASRHDYFCSVDNNTVLCGVSSAEHQSQSKRVGRSTVITSY